jgi:DNA-binding MarR family transcriptional regulator
MRANLYRTFLLIEYCYLLRMKIEDEIKQPRFRDAYQKAVINLLYTANWLQNKNQEFFKSYGITGSQFNILRILKGQHPGRISATEIKSRLLDKNSDVSRLLDRLIAKNLALKQPCVNDKRSFDVLITEQGLELLKSMEKFLPQRDRILALTEDEAKQLSDLLDKSRGT